MGDAITQLSFHRLAGGTSSITFSRLYFYSGDVVFIFTVGMIPVVLWSFSTEGRESELHFSVMEVTVNTIEDTYIFAALKAKYRKKAYSFACIYNYHL